MTTLETCLWHASDWIAWIDRSGNANPDQQALVDTPLEVNFSQSPRDLRVIHKPGRSLLWRSQPQALRRTQAGEASAADRLRPVVDAYRLEGELRDPTGRFLPRRFGLDVGLANGHAIPVYRAPAGVRYQSAGGLRGRVMFADDTPAAWAVIELDVTPPLSGVQTFVAQADGHGEFSLALNRLPIPGRDAPQKIYPASLRVRASLAAAQAWFRDRALTDPDQLPLAPVKSLANLKINPGQIARLASSGASNLILQSPGP